MSCNLDLILSLVEGSLGWGCGEGDAGGGRPSPRRTAGRATWCRAPSAISALLGRPHPYEARAAGSQVAVLLCLALLCW